MRGERKAIAVRSEPASLDPLRVNSSHDGRYESLAQVNGLPAVFLDSLPMPSYVPVMVTDRRSGLQKNKPMTATAQRAVTSLTLIGEPP